MTLPRNWGASPAEVAAPYPCDRFVGGPSEDWFRAVTVEAGADVVFAWLCQLKVAPYSYDLLDNGGRRSPRTRTAGLDRLELGQTFMTIFDLVDFTPGRQVTLRMAEPRFAWLFGALVVSYTVRDREPGTSRLVVKMRVPVESGPVRVGVIRALLGWGDLLMMRRQLRTLGRLAARDAALG
ncbi:hypothetical protein ACWGH8_05240 [Nonomuraea muscovyensis]|uniref:SRPBCC family protein n=1 Tax=Nonomuraea muscovyensis TaxID=1124761 RepID=A0A7X0C4M2_9ACTN|nr:hypothetical protein [Nonomuraea muscovyensis]MBB6347566.1 hypothetical protein [Nonomuraea muscovyensis]